MLRSPITQGNLLGCCIIYVMSVLQVGNDADRPHDKSKNPMWRIVSILHMVALQF